MEKVEPAATKVEQTPEKVEPSRQKVEPSLAPLSHLRISHSIRFRKN